ncbi:MAG: hypothetical protein QM278_07470 [Pseudomonadota bacterium]|nr:hypothetical protein [Pseudomonadota bacterium]
MTGENRLLPILREGVDVIKMVLFKKLREGLTERYPERERLFVNQLAGATINELFGTPNREAPFLSFRIANRARIETELAGLAGDYPELRAPLSDALRVQFLCDSREGLENPALLTRADALGILIRDREVPLPDTFMNLARALGEEHGITLPPRFGSA